MSVPLDISLINQLLNEQRTEGDLNALNKPGFFYVIFPTNAPNDSTAWCHVINLVNYTGHEHTEAYVRKVQIYISDNRKDNTIWFRKYDTGWTDWVRLATATDLPNSPTNNPSQGA